MNLIEFFLSVQNQLKIYHWQTESYAEHKALDKAYEKISDLSDKFLETYMGKYGRIKAKESFKFTLSNYGDDFKTHIEAYVDIFSEDLQKQLKDTDTDLLNIKDEMLGTLNQLLYLLSLS